MKKNIMAASLGAAAVLLLGFAQYKWYLIPGVVIATESELNAAVQLFVMMVCTGGRGA